MCVLNSSGRKSWILLWYALVVFLFSGCSSQATTVVDRQLLETRFRATDLSKIYIDFVTATSDAISIDRRKLLKEALAKQLRNEGMLQEDEKVHSLSLKVVMLSYDAGVLDVQAELYDETKYLAYGRLQREIPAHAKSKKLADVDQAWQQEIEPIAAELLNQLVDALRVLAANQNGDQVVYIKQLVPAYIYTGSYGSNWWRHHDGDRHERDLRVRSSPKPAKQPVSPDVIKALPRSQDVEKEVTSRTQHPIVPSSIYAPPTTSSTDRWAIDPNDSRTRKSGGSSSSTVYSGSGSSSGSVYTPPQTQHEPAYSGGSSTTSTTTSTPVYSAPTPVYTPPPAPTYTPPPAPTYTPPRTTSQPHHEPPAPAPASPPPAPVSAPSPAPASVGAAPGSHHKHHNE